MSEEEGHGEAAEVEKKHFKFGVKGEGRGLTTMFEKGEKRKPPAMRLHKRERKGSYRQKGKSSESQNRTGNRLSVKRKKNEASRKVS